MKSFVVVLFAVAILNARHTPVQTSNLLEIYQTLEREVAVFTDVAVPYAERSISKTKLKTSRRQLVQNEPGALFTLAKLEEMNHSDIGPAVAGNCEIAFTEAAAKHAPMKYQLIEALAEAYSHLSPELQKRILRALENTYTPPIACDAHGGRTVLDWALIRIGRDSVDVLIRLVKNRLKSVRCGADDLLNEIAKNPKFSNNVEYPPVLDCGSGESAAQQSETWYRWWQENGLRAQFPTMSDTDPPM